MPVRYEGAWRKRCPRDGAMGLSGATRIGDYPTAPAWPPCRLSFVRRGRPFVATRAEIHSMAARSPLMTYPVAVKLHPGLSDLQQVGVSSVQRAALAAHGRPGTTQRDPHWRAWTSSSLPSWSPGFSCWSQPRGCSPWQGTPPSRRRPTRSASGIEEIEREALATRKYLFRLAVRNWGPGNRAALFRGHPDLGGRF